MNKTSNKQSFSKIAVIPARGGSTRLKNKNIYPLYGKPLICYTIEAILKADIFDSIVVSTDSKKIAKVASDYDVQIYDREPEFSTEKITVLEALIDMMKKIKKHDIFSFFLPTCPLRNSDDVKNGMALLTQDVDSVISISDFSEPIQLALIKRDETIIPVFDNLTAGLTNSKFIQKYYRPNGSFYISWWDNLIHKKNFFHGNIVGYKMPKIRSVDIDDLCDIIIAEGIIKYQKNVKEQVC